ncbi:MAG TPA: haloacid dehalogenase-like hydrolase [bacterium]|nr:haloacid dehalogenase-like hydrolase [bacterium]HPQ66535.1 haloacid dehalogenase-like hydrolase [bacterium]
MNLAIFDVDGTLTKTLDVDAECFVEAFAQEFGITGFSTDWGSYQHYTDSGIADQIYAEATGAGLDAEAHQRLINRFMLLLSSRANDEPELFGEVDGAGETLERLKAEGAWKIAICTGCWLESARYKLQKAGIDPGGIPLATADDSMVRSRIFRMALKRSRQCYRVRHFDRVVYVGDGVWDVAMTRELDHPFIGIGRGDRADRLRGLGAGVVFPDLSDYPAFRRALEEATVPGGGEDL